MSAGQPPTLKNLRLEGERVLLRPVRAADAEVAFPLIHERREILDWLVWQGPDDVWELEEVYSRWITASEEGNNYHLAVVERATREFVGTLGLRFLDHPWIGDVGYWVASEAWGRGLATEANLLAAHLAFRHLATGVLTAEVFVGNDASARVLEKIGYAREPAVRTQPILGHPTLVDKDEWMFTLTRAEFERTHADWRPVRERIELE